MIKVNNRKFLFNIENKNNEIKNDWAFSHCHKPTPLTIDSSTIRIFFGTRSKKNITRTTFVDLDASNLYDLKVKYVHDKPIFDIGKIGAFDDSGANVCSVVKLNSSMIYMYYIGWNPSTTVHTRNSIGLVVSENGGGGDV